MNTAKSVNGVTIRLPNECWVHITEEHAEMAGYLYDVVEAVQEPLAVFEGNIGELLAAREIETGTSSLLSRSKSGRRLYHYRIFNETLESN